MSRRYLWVFGGLAIFHPACAYDVLVSVQGTIAANSCMVSADSQNLTVARGQMSIKQFYANDVAFGKQPFVITLENCSASTKGVKITFQGEADTSNPHLLRLTPEDGVAQGLAIELLDIHGVMAPINQPMDTLPVDASPGATNAYVFGAQYRSTGAVTEGLANATATFVLEYQ